MRLSALFTSLFILSAFFSNGQLRTPSVITSGMVLQQNDSVTIWGWGYSGSDVKVSGSWDNKVSTGRIANTAKWKVKLKTPSAGGPYTVRIASGNDEIVLTDVLIGEVWLCSGQSNMEWSYYNGARFIKDELATCYNNNIRFFHVARNTSDYPQDDLRAKWTICDSNTIKSFSAVGYYFGKKLNSDLKVPVGLINASWGGTPAEVWTPAEVISGDPVLQQAADKQEDKPWWPIKPGLIYNGMLAPLTSFRLAGAIWYQGESNVSTNETYASLLTKMVDAWRAKWNKQLPFYYVQIAPNKYGNYNVGALLQEQQARAQSHPGFGMVVITDLVDSVTNIHPSNKRDVGYRLANMALAKTYQQDPGAYQSPAYSKAEVVKDRIILTVDHAPNGLVIKGKKAEGFFISGETENWVPADVRIDGNRIILSSKTVRQPVWARYGFGNTLIGNVFSKEGLPLGPFRTDTLAVDQSALPK